MMTLALHIFGWVLIGLESLRLLFMLFLPLGKGEQETAQLRSWRVLMAILFIAYLLIVNSR